jgi:hypothetical protein
MFLLIDNDVFQSVQDADDDVNEQPGVDIEFPWIKVVNAAHNIGEHVPTQLELFKVVILNLFAFFVEIEDFDFSEYV